MAQRDRLPGVESAADKLSVMLDALCRFLLIAGGAAALIGLAFLVTNFNAANNAPADVQKLAIQNIGTFGMLAMVGVIGAGLAVTYLQWGEEVLWAILLIVWAILFLSPLYLPSVFGVTSMNQATQAALTAIQNAGIPIGVIGVLVMVADIITRVKTRVKEGTKADQLKYGKGLKEEKDIRNVFMGKCWQLPYCRKFVRERCPIYHARRTCWKERVGCMCEESVIRNAMEGRVIPSDAVAAAQYIPKNTKLTMDQKAERCRMCVIYNEHQKHKYKLAMPAAIGGTALVYVLFRQPMSDGINSMIGGVNTVVRQATLSKDQNKDTAKTGLGSGEVAFNEIILVALLVVGMAYVIRFIEYLFFKAKV